MKLLELLINWIRFFNEINEFKELSVKKDEYMSFIFITAIQ